MARRHYPLYDTAVPSTAANTEHTLFQVAEGADSTHTKGFTNSRGAGQLPGEESFEIHNIGIFGDTVMPLADREGLYLDSYIEIQVNDQTMIRVPAALCARNDGYQGHFAETTASDVNAIGKVGQGFQLMMPITIPQGSGFKVIYSQGTALTAAENLKVVLDGILED